MFKETYNVIGVMSGTSLDGIDLAHINFAIKNGKWSYEIHESETVSYSNDWLNKLKVAVDFSSEELTELNEDYTELLGKIILSFIEKYSISNLDAVSSHGHTILHQPQNGFTLQIGNLPKIAEIVGENVVCDFRVQDVKFGGQGAPLVPIGDRILFSDYDYCLNLGGFSNISFESNNKRIAFDISPVNTVLNFYSNKLGLDYDDKGKISKSGKINLELLNELNALDYYKKSFPKSLGFEFVKEIVLPLIENYSIAIEDKMHTFTEHIAYQTSLALPIKSGKLLITGGGAYNDFLIERMQFNLPNIQIIIPDNKTLEFKEALIFALLGVLKLRNEVNVLSSVTGAEQDHSTGIIFIP
ncbi:anhydro-N-acetylmuramic acid kinase [Flavobacterium aquatile]|uniref:Anhydro-N-acetylmuramic acid kinase n=1 Tax=Flavobacterium aquatile LMG 4008 = ATCC 11947 TaxID=1453498 RepID=A0A095STM7_9FLAO|nr:anhydro-N-acetylmuramic acid kinase [Flavobacterium aquatile]KGD68006.1 anhydro-N-acetylmuramic acid kinase [Flavobacterium aquatile LMG 4008 = ATCC 11947]OXA68227.1 anhydro-N-acetylmuramic acid kinase [Flavobacterium aquatile LMG 4008 = ATCC 11947]GEC79870.1 anhydro-N-acetylmuramic acid kinase [Flavobacterium aquatile]